jgi:hypothetical protein
MVVLPGLMMVFMGGKPGAAARSTESAVPVAPCFSTSSNHLIGGLSMKVKIMMAVLALFMFAGAIGLGAAQGTKKTTHKKTRTLTGCLQKSDDANEYNLTTGKGGTWEIKSDSVDLSAHVGHTVTVTGVVSNAKMHGMKEDAKAEAKEHGMDQKEKEHGHLTVTDVKMVSDSCKK